MKGGIRGPWKRRKSSVERREGASGSGAEGQRDRWRDNAEVLFTTEGDREWEGE